MEHDPSIYFAVTPRVLRPKEHKINKRSFNISRQQMKALFLSEIESWAHRFM
jgi:hypothetical protein